MTGEQLLRELELLLSQDISPQLRLMVIKELLKYRKPAEEDFEAEFKYLREEEKRKK